MTCIAFAYKGCRDFDADLIGLNRLSMDSSSHHRVIGDSGSHLNSPVSMDGRKVSHAPPIHEQGQATGGTIDILQQIAQTL